jgi:hypothetical protein
MTQDRVFNQQEQARLKQLIDEGTQVLTEMEALKEGLADTVSSIADEMDIKPAILNKAIKVAYKNSLDEERQKFDQLENILGNVNRG